MDFNLAQRLLNMLIRACPVDSGALKQSITMVQYNEKEFLIQIGNESGKEINGSSATNVYASITNDAKQLRFRTKRSQNLLLVKKNLNYHWVNKTVEKWIQENKLKLAVSTNELEEEEELE
jgi:hypothetical protein